MLLYVEFIMRLTIIFAIISQHFRCAIFAVDAFDC